MPGRYLIVVEVILVVQLFLVIKQENAVLGIVRECVAHLHHRGDVAVLSVPLALPELGDDRSLAAWQGKARQRYATSQRIKLQGAMIHTLAAKTVAFISSETRSVWPMSCTSHILSRGGLGGLIV